MPDKKTTTAKATKQASVKVSPRSGTAPPIEKQFGQPNGNPRHNGAWKKEATPRYKLEKILAADIKEIELYVLSEELFVSSVAKILLQLHSLAGTLTGRTQEIEVVFRTLERMLDQVYGKPRQGTDITTGGEKLQNIKVIFDDGGKK